LSSPVTQTTYGVSDSTNNSPVKIKTDNIETIVSSSKVREKGEKITVTTTTIGSIAERKDAVALIALLFSIIGFTLVILSKEKVDDERIDKIRLTAFRDTFIFLNILIVSFLVLEYLTISRFSISILLFSVYLFYSFRYLILCRK